MIYFVTATDGAVSIAAPPDAYIPQEDGIEKAWHHFIAQEAVRHSDRVIITSDNPRNEDPQEIINDMLAGLDASQRRSVLSIVDRREAIRTACTMAQPGDVVLVAGKGHEDYQIVKGVKHHFDDHEVIRDAFGL